MEVREACSALQLCVGLDTRIEAAAHAICKCQEGRAKPQERGELDEASRMKTLEREQLTRVGMLHWRRERSLNLDLETRRLSAADAGDELDYGNTCSVNSGMEEEGKKGIHTHPKK